jgi:hypothetical protein
MHGEYNVKWVHEDLKIKISYRAETLYIVAQIRLKHTHTHTHSQSLLCTVVQDVARDY